MSGYKPTKIVFIGATGNIGSPVIKPFLADKNLSITVLTRASSEKTKALEAQGAKIIEVDYTADRAATVKALQGQQVVISTVGAFGLAAQVEVVRAAKEAGVELFVPSEFGFDLDTAVQKDVVHPLLQPKLATRKAAEEAGIPWLGLTTGVFGSFAAGFLIGGQAAERKATISGDGTTPVAVTAEADIGNFLYATFTNGKVSKADLSNRVLYVAGLNKSFNDYFAETEAKDGRKWDVTRNPLNEAISLQPGLPGFLAWLWIRVAKGDATVKETDHDLVGFKPSVTSFAQLIHD